MLSFLRGFSARRRNAVQSQSFDPLSLTNLVYLYDMEDSPITQSGGSVDQVDDLSGNNDHLVVGGSNKASLVSNVANGKAVLRNIGSASSYYDNTVFTNGTAVTYVAVHRVNNNNYGVFGGFTGGNARLQTNNATQAAYDRTQSGGNSVFDVTNTGDFNIYAYRARSNTDADIILNGAVIATFDPDNQYVGLRSRLFHAANADSDIAFVCCVSRALGDTEIANLTSYLKDRFGIV